MISRGTSRLRNLPRNIGWIIYFQNIAIKFRQRICKKFQFSPLYNTNIAKLIQNIPRATSYHTSFHTIYCVETDGILLCRFTILSLKVSWARDACMQLEHFSRAWRQRKSYLDNILGWHKEIPRMTRTSQGSRHDKIMKSTIVQYVFHTLTLRNSSSCFAIAMSDLRIWNFALVITLSLIETL